MNIINERNEKERNEKWKRFPDVVEAAKADADSIRRIAGDQDMFSVEEELYG